MTYQAVLTKLWSLPALRGIGKGVLERRAWTVEGGMGSGLKLRFPQNRDYISGTSEVPVQRALAEHLRPGAVFYDIGANIGFFSLIAARLVGDTGRVCAFEPHPHNARLVARNAELNGMSHVSVHEVAVGASARREDLQMTDWDGGGALSRYPVGPTSSASRVEVQVVPLDELVATRGLPAPTFVKIDVEGAELEVIEGMQRTLARDRPVLLYEVDDGDEAAFRQRWAELDDRVTALGYRAARLESAYPHLAWHVGHSVAVPQ